MADPIYELPENPEYKSDIRKLQDTDPVRAETIMNPLIQSVLDNIHAVRLAGDSHKTSTDHDNRYYTQDEMDNMFSALETNSDWKGSVNTFADIAVKYPNPDDGWTVNVKDTDYTYRWTGTEWVAISANAIPIATSTVDGKMSKEQAAKLEKLGPSAAVPLVNGMAVAGTDNGRYAREAHVHPVGPATKLQTARTIAISGGATGTATSFNGEANIEIPVTALDVSKVTAGTLPVARGGTGASTASAALTSLGAASASHTHSYAPVSHATEATTYGVATAAAYGHAMASDTAPKAAGTAAVGAETAKFARGDHVHPLQTTVTGNAGTATRLQTARTIAISGGATATATSFSGEADITIPVTALDVSKATVGTLPIARGGTGATAKAAVKTNLGISYGTALPSSGDEGDIFILVV